ncbi:MAG: hypothetical protein ACT4OJ_10815 [Bacteroidota bacterium]
MAYYQKYKLEVKNFEQQMVKALIEDTFSPEENPYGLSHNVVDDPGPTQTVNVSWTSVPPGCTSTYVEARDSNGVLVGSHTSTPTSPMTWTTCPDGNHVYLFFFYMGTDFLYYTLGPGLEGVTDDLQPAADAFRLLTDNNNENKINPIVGQRLVMKFISTNQLNLNKLLAGPYSDRRYRVTASINDRVFFRGFLQMGDAQEAFMPHGNPIELTATCGLASLKNKTLKNFTDENPTGYNKIIDYVAWCLRQTGIVQDIYVAMNIREEGIGTIAAAPGGHFFNQQFLHALTFEAEPGESEDCYSVLEKMMGNLCRISQRHGSWFIKNWDEFDNQPDYVGHFNSLGVFQSMLAAATYEKEIGRGENMKWSNHSAIIGFTSPAKFGKLLYRYENPQELPCNVDMERGDYIADIDADSKKYELDCWDKHKEAFGGGDGPPDADIYIQRNFFNGYENERFLVFDGSVGNFVKSGTIPVKAKDKIRVGMNRRMSADVSGSGFFRDIAMQVRLYANDGTYWSLQGETSAGDTIAWVQTDPVFNSPAKFLYFEGDASADQTESQTLYGTTESPGIPKDGYIRLCVHQSHMTAGDWPGKDTWVDKVEFHLLHYINGSYDKYVGQHNKVSQGNDDLEKLDEQVYVSDAPGRVLKGALHKYNGSDYELSGLFWNASLYPAGVPDPSYNHPFGYIQAFNVWNQIWMLQRIFRGSIQGIESSSVDGLGRCDLPTIHHTYRLRDTDSHTNSKKFMLLSYDIDLVLCEFNSAVLKQCHDETVGFGKRYTDTHEFKYLTR